MDLAALFDASLGEDVSALRDTVRRFADDRVAPLADETDRQDRFPRHLWPEMGALGLHGITVREEFGGADMGYLAHCVAMEELSRASASIGLSYGAHSNLCINQIHRWGTTEQKKRYLPKLIADVHGALKTLRSNGGASTPAELKPAVPIRKSIAPDYLICLEDGKKFKSLKRHLRTHYDLSPEQYREKWGLPADYPMVAPNYSETRSRLAKDNGLGRKAK